MAGDFDILSLPWPLNLYPTTGHAERGITVHRAQGEMLTANQPENGVARSETLLLVPRLHSPCQWKYTATSGPSTMDPINGKVKRDLIIHRKVSLDLGLQLVETLDRHKQALKRTDPLLRIGLSQELHRGIDIPDAGGILRIDVAGLGTGSAPAPSANERPPHDVTVAPSESPRP